jgi:serine/threonine protein phosphatase PrpC
LRSAAAAGSGGTHALGTAGRVRSRDIMSVSLTVYGQTDVGLVRRSNEDAFAIADLTEGGLVEAQRFARFEIGQRGALLAVSDGMGGHRAGEVASALVVESLCSAMTAESSGGRSDALLEKATVHANRAVWQAAHCPNHEGMGATLTALFVHGSTAYIAEVGDSRAYVLRGGQMEQVTHDQSYLQLLVDSGAMSRERAWRSGLGNVILQAMGLAPEVTVALGRLDLRQSDCLLLCSDGLSNKMTIAELRSVILTSPRLDVAGARLIELARERGGEDNITAVLAGVSGDLPPIVSGESIAETLFVLQEFKPPSASVWGGQLVH